MTRSRISTFLIFFVSRRNVGCCARRDTRTYVPFFVVGVKSGASVRGMNGMHLERRGVRILPFAPLNSCTEERRRWKPFRTENLMKQFFSLLLLLVFVGCTEDGTLTGPSAPTETPTQTPTVPPPAPTWYYVDLTGYSEALEPNYMKVYSDGSWEKYGGIDFVNGKAYLAIVASDTTRYYYTMTTGQYAGYKQPSGDPIMFAVPQAFLPTRWRSDTTVTLASNFTHMGYLVSVTTSYKLVDTARVVNSLGSFSPVAYFKVWVDIRASSVTHHRHPRRSGWPVVREG